MAVNFVPGWNFDVAMAADTRLIAGGRYCTVRDDGKPIPKAFSLTGKRIKYYMQGNAGSCWTHSAKQMAEVSAKALGYEAFPVCRRLIGWAGKQLEGGGNMSDGGSPTDAVTTMTSGRGGYGIAHEDLLPYTDDYRTLGQRPPQKVFDDAKRSHLVAPVKVTSLDQCRKMIASGRPVANGFPWPANFDDGQTFLSSAGQIVGGHSVLLVGYALAGVFDQYSWVQFDNWHGLLYPPLPPALAIKVPGYMPINTQRTSDAWVREDVYVRLCQQGCEHVSATDFDGIMKEGIAVASDDLVKQISDIFIA
jgi:hypothetical protein